MIPETVRNSQSTIFWYSTDIMSSAVIEASWLLFLYGSVCFNSALDSLAGCPMYHFRCWGGHILISFLYTLILLAIFCPACMPHTNKMTDQVHVCSKFLGTRLCQRLCTQDKNESWKENACIFARCRKGLHVSILSPPHTVRLLKGTTYLPYIPEQRTLKMSKDTFQWVL